VLKYLDMAKRDPSPPATARLCFGEGNHKWSLVSECFSMHVETAPIPGRKAAVCNMKKQTNKRHPFTAFPKLVDDWRIGCGEIKSKQRRHRRR
jgi:hypothetical protein